MQRATSAARLERRPPCRRGGAERRRARAWQRDRDSDPNLLAARSRARPALCNAHVDLFGRSPCALPRACAAALRAAMPARRPALHTRELSQRRTACYQPPMPEIAGINAANVSRFFRERIAGGDVELEFALISGGRSNLTYTVRGGRRSWVLRRPPLGHVLPTAHDMALEYRVLAALADTNVPVARPLALCEDAAVNDMPFYVMEYVSGVVPAPALPPGLADNESERRRMSLAMIENLVVLNAIE